MHALPRHQLGHTVTVAVIAAMVAIVLAVTLTGAVGLGSNSAAGRPVVSTSVAPWINASSASPAQSRLPKPLTLSPTLSWTPGNEWKLERGER